MLPLIEYLKKNKIYHAVYNKTFLKFIQYTESEVDGPLV